MLFIFAFNPNSFNLLDTAEVKLLSLRITKEVTNPFYNKFSRSTPVDPIDSIENIEEYEPALDEIEAFEKLDDPYFHTDDQ